ncbi:MAG: RluA family pseudouridine synthase [Anaerolineales bacterium]
MDLDPHPLTIYSDATILVINKPAGLRTLPDGYDPGIEHVASVLADQYGQLWIVHRLDKETSGILVLARTAEAHRALNAQFDQHLVKKTYHAIVDGCPAWHSKIIQSPLRVNGDRHHRTVVDLRGGKASVTQCRVLEAFSAHALLEIQPKTGRTHQIRAHLASIGFPILQDSLYNKTKTPSEMLPIQRLALHAFALEFTHPAYNTLMHFTAPYPADFQNCLEHLRQQLSLPKSKKNKSIEE